MHGGEAARVQATQERNRQAGLLHAQSYLARDWESAVVAERGPSAGLDGQRRALTVARAQVSVLQAQVAAAQAALDGKRAALAPAQVQEKV